MSTTKRLLSLDVFRGMTIAGMILVNNPGSWSHVYPPLLHAEWHGATPTDWVFPFFLFIVGVAITYAMGNRLGLQADMGAIHRKIFTRTLLIFAIGLFLNAFPAFNMGTVRIPGVLQRIALVYGITALLYLHLGPRKLLAAGILILWAYWGMMTLIPVPVDEVIAAALQSGDLGPLSVYGVQDPLRAVGEHYIAPNLGAGGNLGAWLDRQIMHQHLWRTAQNWDPEGLLSTIPAVGTCISGVLAGIWLRSPHTDHEKVSGLLSIGAILLALGWIWHLGFPINKKIWTSSYVLYAAGIAMLFLGTVYWLVDIKGYKRWAQPFVVYGTNALFVFVLSGLVPKIMGLINVGTHADGTPRGLHTWLWEAVYSPMFSEPKAASLAYALTNVLFFWLLSWVLYRRKIFIKV